MKRKLKKYKYKNKIYQALNKEQILRELKLKYKELKNIKKIPKRKK